MTMAFDIHHLMQFAERTNDLMCSANENLERIANHPSLEGAGEKGYSSSLKQIIMKGRICKNSYVPFRHTKGGPSSIATESVTSVREQRAPSLLPGLPVEVLERIFYLLEQQQLLPVMLSNNFLHVIARRRFYRAIVIRSPTDAIAFLKRLLHNPELPPLVRSFQLSIMGQTGKKHAAVGDSPVVSSETIQPSSDSASTTSTPLPTNNFYSLLNRGLCTMRSLHSLTLELPMSHSPVWIFNDCTFMLRQFTTSMDCNCHLAKFLEKQQMIEDLTLRGFQIESLFAPFLGAAAAALVTGPSIAPPHPATTTDNSISLLSFSLSSSALSRLKSFNAIHAGPAIVHTIMQDRSVEIASVPFFPGLTIPTLNALGSGNASLRRLNVISFDPDAPLFLFKELAWRFKDLEALHLVLLMTEHSNGLYEDAKLVLPNFTSLKYITFMAASSSESASIDETKIARDWRRACPTLRTIILPKGSVWCQGEDPGVQIEDLSVAAAQETTT